MSLSTIVKLVQFGGNKTRMHEIDAQTTIVTLDYKKMLIGLHICLNFDHYWFEHVTGNVKGSLRFEQGGWWKLVNNCPKRNMRSIGGG